MERETPATCLKLARNCLFLFLLLGVSGSLECVLAVTSHLCILLLSILIRRSLSLPTPSSHAQLNPRTDVFPGRFPGVALSYGLQRQKGTDVQKGTCGCDPQAALTPAQEAPVSEDFADTQAEAHFHCPQLTVSCLHFTVWRQTEEPSRGLGNPAGPLGTSACYSWHACMYMSCGHTILI